MRGFEIGKVSGEGKSPWITTEPFWAVKTKTQSRIKAMPEAGKGKERNPRSTNSLLLRENQSTESNRKKLPYFLSFNGRIELEGLKQSYVERKLNP